MATIDATTEAFLEALADDLLRQLPRGISVGSLRVEEWETETALVARIVIGESSTEARGSGETVLMAYANLRRAVAEAAVTLSVEQLIFGPTPSHPRYRRT